MPPMPGAHRSTSRRVGGGSGLRRCLVQQPERPCVPLDLLHSAAPACMPRSDSLGPGHRTGAKAVSCTRPAFPSFAHPGLTPGTFISPSSQTRKLRPRGGSTSPRPGCRLVGGGQLLFRLLGVVLPTLCPLLSHVCPQGWPCQSQAGHRVVEKVTEDPPDLSSDDLPPPQPEPQGPGEVFVQRSGVALWAWVHWTRQCLAAWKS